ncbi:protein C2-DOMAIN ABA-RELATED 5-like [Humulus lupulus]|uniref:protein C2-DOMAIN ABA-RELATED 5-like n=1 Tax=Humulus lupulus TaxID=3486 RepID=UPI002B4025E0|nr:protein C2-DOMAIN ABA-RELATED 5-like [Humulus lupulus]
MMKVNLVRTKAYFVSYKNNSVDDYRFVYFTAGFASMIWNLKNYTQLGFQYQPPSSSSSSNNNGDSDPETSDLSHGAVEKEKEEEVSRASIHQELARLELKGNEEEAVLKLDLGIMEEQLGLLKVVVVQGKRLVIRDFKSSDPYVVVKLGNQTAKTKVINSFLNPIWNEELTFSLKEPNGVLNLEVFDKDLLKTNDKMGHAQLSLQPLVSAARLRQIL